jgi:hypothetical protein
MVRFFFTMMMSLIAVLPGFAQAGSSEAGAPVLPRKAVEAFADRVQQDLAARGAHVAIVARKGRDPADLPDGIIYTHVGFWVYSRIVQPNGAQGLGYRVYNLYQGAEDKTRSRLVQDGPADFFAGAYSLDAGVIIPAPRLQQKLLEVINSPTYAALHNANYSVLANPRSSQFQNCTEHTLDVVMASVYDEVDTRRIKANIRAYFHPQVIKVSGLKRLLAPFASAALTTADHGRRIETATFGSIARFMRTYDLAAQVYRISPNSVIVR